MDADITKREIEFPPVCSIAVPNMCHNVVTAVTERLEEVSGHMTQLASVWDTECHVLQKLIYKQTGQFRGQKILASFKRIYKLYLRYRELGLHTYIGTVLGIINDSQKKRIPSSDMMSFLLTQLFRIVMVIRASVDSCLAAYRHVEDKLGMGHFIANSLLYSAVIARIWYIGNAMLRCTTQLYDYLRTEMRRVQVWRQGVKLCHPASLAHLVPLYSDKVDDNSSSRGLLQNPGMTPVSNDSQHQKESSAGAEEEVISVHQGGADADSTLNIGLHLLASHTNTQTETDKLTAIQHTDTYTDTVLSSCENEDLGVTVTRDNTLSDTQNLANDNEQWDLGEVVTRSSVPVVQMDMTNSNGLEKLKMKMKKRTIVIGNLTQYTSNFYSKPKKIELWKQKLLKPRLLLILEKCAIVVDRGQYGSLLDEIREQQKIIKATRKKTLKKQLMKIASKSLKHQILMLKKNALLKIPIQQDPTISIQRTSKNSISSTENENSDSDSTTETTGNPKPHAQTNEIKNRCILKIPVTKVKGKKSLLKILSIEKRTNLFLEKLRDHDLSVRIGKRKTYSVTPEWRFKLGKGISEYRKKLHQSEGTSDENTLKKMFFRIVGIIDEVKTFQRVKLPKDKKTDKICTKQKKSEKQKKITSIVVLEDETSNG